MSNARNVEISFLSTEDPETIRQRRAQLDNIRPLDSLNGLQITAIEHAGPKTIIMRDDRTSANRTEIVTVNRATMTTDKVCTFSDSVEASNEFCEQVQYYQITSTEENDEHQRTREAEQKMEQEAAQAERHTAPISSPRRARRNRL